MINSNKMKITTKIFAILSLLFFGTGCNTFLEVDPKSTIGQEQLFSSEVGFQQALTGVYSQVASKSLYGDNMSMGFVSMIGQNYSPNASLFPFKQTVALNFKTGDAISFVSSIWSSAYKAIAGTNTILAEIDAKKSIFTENNYALVKGETLGLRAYLHFDLLRLYGANFATNSSKKSIPYRTVSNALSKVPSTVDEVSALVLEDLLEAEQLLKNTDAMVLGVNKNRRFKMNYYAIKGLQARVYLFRGDKVNAAKAAKEVVESGKFAFVTSDEINANPGSRDRLFSNEHVFALRVKNIKEWVEGSRAYFKIVPSDSRYSLTRTEVDFKTLYEVDKNGSTDIRSSKLLETEGTTIFCSKFWQTSVLGSGQTEIDRLDQTVPLVRLSEMYYILAETAATPAEGLVYLNKVRVNRVLPEILSTGLTSQNLEAEILKEYQKEFYAEGQLFFYYKRKLTVRMLFGAKNLSETNYIVPVPDNELEFNPNYN